MIFNLFFTYFFIIYLIIYILGERRGVGAPIGAHFFLYIYQREKATEAAFSKRERKALFYFSVAVPSAL